MLILTETETETEREALTMSDADETFAVAMGTAWVLAGVTMIVHAVLWTLGVVAFDGVTWWIALAFLLVMNLVQTVEYVHGRWWA